MSDFSDDYTNFLKTRSFKAKIYRKYFLYPILSKYLDGNCIDIGCGLGDFLNYRKNTVGFDVNVSNVEFCRSIGLNAKKMELDKLDLPDDSIDSIIFDNVLEHIKEPTSIILEIYRVLKDNGNLVVGVPGVNGFNKAPDHEIYYTPENLDATFNRFGFKLIKMIYTPFKFFLFDKYLSIYCYYGVFKK